MVSPVVLPPDVADAVRDFLVGDPAVVSLVVDLDVAGTGIAAPSARFAAVMRSAAPVSPGDFVVIGGFPSDSAANAAFAAIAGMRPVR